MGSFAEIPAYFKIPYTIHKEIVPYTLWLCQVDALSLCHMNNFFTSLFDTLKIVVQQAFATRVTISILNY